MGVGDNRPHCVAMHNRSKSVPLDNLVCGPAGEGMVAWEGCTTALPQGFTALRLETICLTCYTGKRLAHVGSEAQRSCTSNAVHLLCRALRLAPACYRQFSIAALPQTGRRCHVRSLMSRACCSRPMKMRQAQSVLLI